MFGLPDFHDLLLTFHGRNRSVLRYEEVDIWDGVRMQLRSVQDDELILPPLTVKACPEGPQNGVCNFVLVKDEADANCSGIRGATSI